MTRKHDRGAFDCGDTAPNVFLMRYARQSHDQGGAKTFLAVDGSTRAVIGFYSLAPAARANHRAPEIVQCGLGTAGQPDQSRANLIV